MDTMTSNISTRAEQRNAASLIAFYRSAMESHKDSPGTYGNWRSNLIYLSMYVRETCGTDDIPLADLTKEWAEGYRTFLATTNTTRSLEEPEEPPTFLCPNTTAAYFSKFRACLRGAYRSGLTERNLAELVETVPMEETERSYLTLSELRHMVSASCQPSGLKRAFLFSCLTGLRRCDVERLTWRQVAEEAGFTRIKFRQKKTRGLEYLDISPQAAQLLGPRAKADECVFSDFHYSSYALKCLRKWAERANVDKYITYHTSRHTFAVLLLSSGSDLYTLQRLLGHRSIETTQIYAHILDTQKRDAVMRLPQILPDVEPHPAMPQPSSLPELIVPAYNMF